MENLVNRIKHITLNPKARVLVISDIHGSYELLKKLLVTVEYTQSDYLFILGDLIEKGPENLKTLRYVMELSKDDNVFILLGNNDTILYDVKYNSNTHLYYDYISSRSSIYTEMCEELGISCNSESDFASINEILRSNFAAEIDFIINLPTIIETERLLFAHSGIDDYENMSKLDPYSIVKNDLFMKKAKIMPKLLIVGHYPVIAYCSSKPSLAPQRDFKKRICSIDGGNVINESGQLNCLILDSESTMNISYVAVDDLPKKRVINNQTESTRNYIVSWDKEITNVTRINDNESKCQVVGIDEELIIPNQFLYLVNGQWHCEDYTNYYPILHKNDIVSFIKTEGEKSLIKIDSIIGWTNSNNLQNL